MRFEVGGREQDRERRADRLVCVSLSSVQFPLNYHDIGGIGNPYILIETIDFSFICDFSSVSTWSDPISMTSEVLETHTYQISLVCVTLEYRSVSTQAIPIIMTSEVLETHTFLIDFWTISLLAVSIHSARCTKSFSLVLGLLVTVSEAVSAAMRAMYAGGIEHTSSTMSARVSTLT